MAISTTCYFSNSLVGVPQVAGDVDVYEVHATPKFAVGTKFERQDGAIFRYGHFGTAISTIGALVAPDVSAVNILPVIKTTINAPSATYQKEADPTGVYPSSRGSRFISMGTAGMASITADQLKGGTIVITVGTGQGYAYRIKGNTAVGNPAAGMFLIELYDTIRSASLDTTSAASITISQYSNLLLAQANTAAGIVVGATLATSSATFAWGWVQTKGVGPAIMGGLNVLAGGQGLLSIGKPAVVTSSGACAAASTSTGGGFDVQINPIVGICVAVASSGAVGLVKYQLE